MTDHGKVEQRQIIDSGNWMVRSGLILLGSMLIAGGLFVVEHRTHVFTDNAFLIALLTLCIGVHFFMHRGHGNGGR